MARRGFRTTALRPAHLQQGGRSFTRPSGPDRARRGLVCSRCSGGSAVEVGSSHVVARLLSLTVKMSCISVVKAVGQFHKLTDDGNFKIVVCMLVGGEAGW
jgi:hypothetical protein